MPLRIYATVCIKEKKNAAVLIHFGIVRIKAETDESLMLRLWFDGIKIIEKPLSLLISDGGEDEVSTEDKDDKEGRKDKEDTGKFSGISFGDILFVKDEFLKILHEFSFDRFSAQIKFGFDDPTDTAMIYGYLSALKGVLYIKKGLVLDVYPDFKGLFFECESEFAVSVKRVFKLIMPAYRIIRRFLEKKSTKKSSRRFFIKTKTAPGSINENF